VLRRMLTTAAATALALGLMAVPALAAPPASNPQLESFPVTCGEETFLVSVPQKSSGVAVFTPDGRVAVAKNFSGAFEGTLTLDPLPDEESGEVLTGGGEFSERRKGIDPSRLVTCTFTETFTETVVVDADLLDFLDAAERTDLIGRSGTLSGAFTGTVEVLFPGKR
jgi:hypothetical protein